MSERYSTPCVDCGRPTKAQRCRDCKAARAERLRVASLTGKHARRAKRQEAAR